MFKPKFSTKQVLRVIVVGCGKVGATLVERLSREGHDITIIDKDADKVDELTDAFDIMGVVGNGASYNTQKEAGIEEADLIIAVTESDELNLLCCTIATQVGDCSAIARIRTPDYSNEAGYIRDKLGLSLIINLDMEAAKEIANILYLPTALEVNSFAHGQADMIKFKVTDNNLLCNQTVASISQMSSSSILICAIERKEEIYIPSGDFKILSGDIIYFVSPRRGAKTFLGDIGFKTNQVSNALIVGGSNTAFYLAKMLLTMGINVKIIEKDMHRCEELSTLLPKAVIINDDGTNPEVLTEAGLEYAEAFIPLTGMDEENILLNLHARHVSKAKVVTKLDHINFKEVISSLDLGSVLYPRYITSEAIIAYVRAKKNSMNSNIETLYHIFDSRAEAIEFSVTQKSEVTNIPLKDLSLKDNLLISFINRNGKILIPSGMDCIEVGDTVMIVTTHTGFDNIKDILK